MPTSKTSQAARPGTEAGGADETAIKTLPKWLTQLRGWADNGTLERVGSCIDSGEVVRVRRSNGETQAARVVGMGHAGRGVMLRFATGDGEREKYVHTDDFLALNPGLDLTPGCASADQP